MEKEWYVVNTYSGHEYKVKEKLESKIESMGLQDNIFRIVILSFDYITKRTSNTLL